jgi:hypothetical protein
MAKKVLDILGGLSFACGGTGAGSVKYTDSFELPDGEPAISIEYQAGSDGNVALKLELEQSNTAPTANAADGDSVVPDGAAELNNTLTDKLVHIKAYSPAATKFARFKITGNSGNDASTVLSRLNVTIIK